MKKTPQETLDYKRAYYIKNREKLTAAARLRRATPEAKALHAESIRRYRAAHPDRVQEAKRKWRETHAAKVAEEKRKWRAENPQHVRDYQKAWRARNKDRIKGYNVKAHVPGSARSKQGLPEPTRPQPVGCEICTRELTVGKTHLDHCHDTGKFRGWLCNRCNLSLGHLGDNAAGLRRALAYLEKFECANVD